MTVLASADGATDGWCVVVYRSAAYSCVASSSRRVCRFVMRSGAVAGADMVEGRGGEAELERGREGKGREVGLEELSGIAFLSSRQEFVAAEP
jgi:hypothetical protein